MITGSIQGILDALGDKEYTFGKNDSGSDMAAGVAVCLDKDDVDAVDLTLPTALEHSLLHGILEEAVATGKHTNKIVKRGVVDALVDGDTIDVAVGDLLVPNTSGHLVPFVREEPIPITDARVHDALQTIIGTAGNDDLGITTGTPGTNAPYIGSGDSKAASTTRRCSFLLPITKPLSGLTLRANAGMVTTVADTSATLDFEVWRLAAPSVDICATAAQSINSLTAADKDFTITTTNVVPGDILIIRATIAIVDSATGTAVIGALNSLTARWKGGTHTLSQLPEKSVVALEANTGAAALKAVYVNL